MGRSEIRSSGVERQSCNDQPPTGSKPLRSNLPERHTLQRKLLSTSFFPLPHGLPSGFSTPGSRALPSHSPLAGDARRSIMPLPTGARYFGYTLA